MLDNITLLRAARFTSEHGKKSKHIHENVVIAVQSVELIDKLQDHLREKIVSVAFASSPDGVILYAVTTIVFGSFSSISVLHPQGSGSCGPP